MAVLSVVAPRKAIPNLRNQALLHAVDFSMVDPDDNDDEIFVDLSGVPDKITHVYRKSACSAVAVMDTVAA